MADRFQYEPRFGAQPIEGGKTRFRLWAPARDDVQLLPRDGEPVPMTKGADGTFEAVARCPAGTRYRFRLDDGMTVPDPASRRQDADVHDWSVVVDPRAYRWTHGGWRGRPWRETVIYEVHAGAAGGFAGIMHDLHRLKELGVTAVELMPVNDFPGRYNWGYDGVLPYAPDSAYGTPEDLKALVDAAHGLELMVFLDVVYNHFGPDGNYISAYAPQFFRDDLSTPWGGAIDFRLPPVRDYFTDNALYWLEEYRFDGLRFDAVHAIAPSDWLEETGARIRQRTAGRDVHLMLENERNDAGPLAGPFDAQWNDDIHHCLHVLLTGEAEAYYEDYADEPARRLARALAEGFVYQGQVSPHLDRPRGTPSAGLPPTAFIAALQNHDQVGNRAMGDRLTVLAEPKALVAATALQLLSPQIPMIFFGEETASPTPFLFFTDHHGDLADAVREGRRKEFAKFQAFADPERRAKIPDPNAPGTFHASIPRPGVDAAARTALYRRLLSLRRTEIAPHLGGATSLGAQAPGPAAVVARWRLGDGRVLALATNLGQDETGIEPPPGRVLYETSFGAGTHVLAGRLPPLTTVALLDRPA